MSKSAAMSCGAECIFVTPINVCYFSETIKSKTRNHTSGLFHNPHVMSVESFIRSDVLCCTYVPILLLTYDTYDPNVNHVCVEMKTFLSRVRSNGEQ